MAVNPLLIKAAVAVATDKRFWITLVSIIVGFLLVITSVVAVIINSFSFILGGKMDIGASAQYKEYVVEMKQKFDGIESEITSLNSKMNGETLESEHIKAVFYTLYFGDAKTNFDSAFYKRFVNCFVSRGKDEDGKEIIKPVGWTESYINIENLTGKSFSENHRNNVGELYYNQKYGSSKSDENYEVDNSEIDNSTGQYGSPFIGINWRNYITSEYGMRKNPTGIGEKMHTGLDIGMPKGTPINAVDGGVVLYAKRDITGYGYHLAIEHASGIVTLYAHCSELLISPGQKVAKGEVIAKVGTTGNSTGNHLHIEFLVNGKQQNPIKFLN